MYIRASTEAAADFRGISFRFDAGRPWPAGYPLHRGCRGPPLPMAAPALSTLDQNGVNQWPMRGPGTWSFSARAPRELCMPQMKEGACPSGERVPLRGLGRGGSQTPHSPNRLCACSPSVVPSARLYVPISVTFSSPASGSAPRGAGESSGGPGRSQSTESYGRQCSKMATFLRARLTATTSSLSLRRFRGGRSPRVSSGAPSRACRAFGGSPRGPRRPVLLIGLSM
jgi:hypothetical protein